MYCKSQYISDDKKDVTYILENKVHCVVPC